MRHKISAAIIVSLITAFVAPAGGLNLAHADKRCTPIGHVLDASKIPGNEGDKNGLNCIPTYELDFAGALAGTLPSDVFQESKCDPESAYDQVAASIKADPAFYKVCRRLKFTMGPLIGRPGMNDSLLHVTTFEHPMYDGYTLRWKPGLQKADGTVPPVQDFHLHHGTWIGGLQSPTTAGGPFFATGEEQTILQFPKGYGWSMKGLSSWEMLYMLHNATEGSMAVYITYDIDYISAADAAALGGITDLKSIWMDAGAGGQQQTWDDSTGPVSTTNVYSGFNPIFNAQRGKGHLEDFDTAGAFYGLTGSAGSPLTTVPIRNNHGITGKMVCTFPRENCANFDSSQGQSPQQGIATPKIIGRNTKLDAGVFGDCSAALGPGKKCATLINMGGHLHPGGVRDEVSVLRGDKIVPILISDAVYWGGANYQVPASGGAPANSWDLSMTGQLAGRAGDGRAKDAWKILIQPGDKIILNGVYDTSIGSAYDQMAIVMSWMNPGYEPDAIDPFDPNVIFDAGWESSLASPAAGGLTPRPPGLPAAIDYPCYPGTRGPSEPDAGKTVLCLRGNVTHGSMPSRQQHWDCVADNNCPAFVSAVDAGTIPLASSTITMQDFKYGQLDMGYAANFGVTKIKPGTELTFYNPDTAGMIWHTVTSCPAPCTGTTSASYPYPASYDTPVDFDSTILCVGLGCSTAGTTQWTFKVPDTAGTYTFFCRIHPNMRGIFEVA